MAFFASTAEVSNGITRAPARICILERFKVSWRRQTEDCGSDTRLRGPVSSKRDTTRILARGRDSPAGRSIGSLAISPASFGPPAVQGYGDWRGTGGKVWVRRGGFPQMRP